MVFPTVNFFPNNQPRNLDVLQMVHIPCISYSMLRIQQNTNCTFCVLFTWQKRTLFLIHPFVRSLSLLLFVFQFWSIIFERTYASAFELLTQLFPNSTLNTRNSYILNADCCLLLFIHILLDFDTQMLRESVSIQYNAPFRIETNRKSTNSMLNSFSYTNTYNSLKLKTNWNGFCFKDNQQQQLAQYAIWNSFAFHRTQSIMAFVPKMAVFLIHQQTCKMDWTFLRNIELKPYGFWDWL